MSTATASTYTILARIEVTVRDGVPLGRVIGQVRRQINEMGQNPEAWPAGTDDAEWWVGVETKAVLANYENVGDSLAAEAGKVAGWERDEAEQAAAKEGQSGV